MDDAAAEPTPTPDDASNDDLCMAFQFNDAVDRDAFTQICNAIRNDDDCNSDSIPTPLIAVVLTSIIKGLRPYLTQSSGNNNVEVFRGLALNFVRYQSQFAPHNGSSPVTFVQVAQQCSSLVKKWDDAEPDMNSIIMKMYLYLLDGFILPGKRGNSLSTIIQDESFKKLGLIQKLLIQTLDNICVNTIECLEDLADFEYLWGATNRDPGEDKPLFGPNGISTSTYNNLSVDGDELGHSQGVQYKCPKCLKEFHFSSSQTGAASFSNHVRACKREGQQVSKKRKGHDSSVTPQSIRQCAKELAWVVSMTSNPNGERKQRIVNTAACVDLITASLMAPIISASATKRRRLERGVIDPRRSEDVESAAALSIILTGQGGIKSDAEYSRRLREKSKKSLLQATSDLLSSVTNETTPIQHKDILAGAQKVSSCIIPWLVTEQQSNKNSSPASQLLAFMRSHQLRQKNLHRLKEIYHNATSDKMKENFSNTSLEDISNDQKVLKMAWFIANLQRIAFIDTVDEFFYLSSTERKCLAPFAASPSPSVEVESSVSFSVRAITYRVPEPQPMRCALQISRVKNEPLTEAELKDVNEWSTALCCIVSESSSIKPSPWLMNYLEPPPAVGVFVGQMIAGSWKSKILPVLRYFIRIVANDCQLSLHDCTISDAGKYKVQQGDTTPGAVLMMYYLSLETIIRSSPVQYTMVHDAQRFHSSLFSLCYFCLRKAKQPDGRCFLIEDIGTCPIEFYKLVELFIQVLKPADSTSVMENRSLNLPAYLIRILRQLQTMLLGMIWMSDGLEVKVDSTFLGMVSKLRENPRVWNQTFPTSSNENSMQGINKEQNLVGYMLGNLIHVVDQRVTTLCHLLGVSCVHTTSEKTMDLFQKVLRHRTDIFFDRHPDQLMLCSLYATLCAQRKKYAPKVCFQKVADAYISMNRDVLGSEIPYTILHRVKNCSDNAHWFGDILLLYNKVFVPAVQSFWRSFKDEVREAQLNNEASRDSFSRNDVEMRNNVCTNEENAVDQAMENIDDEINDDNVDDGSHKCDESLKDPPTKINGNNQAFFPANGAGFNNPSMQGDEGVSKDKDDTDDDGGGKMPAKPNGGDGKYGFSLPDQSDSSSASSSGEEEVDDGKASNLAESEVNTSLDDDDDDDKALGDKVKIVSTGADHLTERNERDLSQQEVDTTKDEEVVMQV